MANTFRDGTVNIAAINVPGTYIDIIPPTPFINAAQTNIEAFVGVGSWGIPNTVQTLANPSDAASKVGLAQVRPFDIATAFAAAYSQGSNISGRCVRVTDGTDVAATVTIPSSFGTFTAKSTGTLGNKIGIAFAASAAPGAYSALVQFPGRIAERYDNIYQGLASLAVGAAGTGYTSIPSIVLSQPQYTKLGTFPASAQATLTNVGIPLATTGGSGYAIGDKITLNNGLVLTVATLSVTAVATVTVFAAASVTTGTVSPTGNAQVSTTGAGTGAVFSIVWGLGPATISSSGQGYTSAVTATVSGGGGTGGTYTAGTSYAAAFAAAINSGTVQRAKSGYVVFTAGTGTAAPTTGTVYQLSGGTDGANGVNTASLIGLDALPRTGMYALRSTGMDTFMLCDLHDTTAVPAMLALAIDETCNFAFSTASGDTINGAIASRVAIGLDDTNAWFIAGDAPTFNDGINGPRLVDPAAFALGLAGNLSPEQSPINKALIGVQATQTSQSGIITANPDNALAQEGGIDLIGRSTSLGSVNFTFLTGRNSSSNTAARGIEYSRLTNFIARSLQGPATRAIVGKLQSTNRPDDPTRLLAKATLDSFFGILVNPSFGSGGYGLIEAFANQCDLNNNPPSSIQRGFLIAFSAALYLNAVRYFVIKFNGGGNVVVNSGISTATTVGGALALLTGSGAGASSST